MVSIPACQRAPHAPHRARETWVRFPVREELHFLFFGIEISPFPFIRVFKELYAYRLPQEYYKV